MSRDNYLDKPSRKGKSFNKVTKAGKLTKDGQVYKNNLMDVDFTSQTATRRKLKA